MASSLTLLFLSLLGSSRALPPRFSFPLNSPERPLVHFNLADVSDTTTLLLSNDSSTLYVGATNAILLLNVSRSDVISLWGQVTWRPSEADRKDCAFKVQDPEVDCQNFVHVVQRVNSTHLYVCGSNAYNPQQAFIDMENMWMVQQNEARGRCPFSPFERSSAVIIDQELFAATTTNFKGSTPQISRFLSKDGRPDISLDSSISLLEDPKFVSVSLDPAEQKLYFFFSEIGKEFSFVDELQIRIPRVAQVCKDDVGGQRILQKKWTSFAKSPLLCQPPEQLPFNILEDMFTLQPPEGADASETLFYGVFTSQWSRRSESAVCTFKLKDIRDVFAGSFKTLEKGRYQLKPPTGRQHLGQCGLSNSSDAQLSEVKMSYLTDRSVKPVGPVFVFPEQKYSRVVVMKTTAANSRQYDVLFLLTESGFLHKAVPSDQDLRVVEEIQVFREPQRAKSMILSSSKGLVYVGTSEGVTAVPVARCLSYRSCMQCILARDPLCGWSPTRRTCTGLDGAGDGIVQSLEKITGDECQPAERILQHRDVFVRLHEVVTLQCVKPSNLAVLRWSFADDLVLLDRLFIQAANGSLHFQASSGTFGIYRCEAEEDGLMEVVASYDVRQAEIVPTSRKDSRSMKNPAEEAPTQKSYHSELVVVSLLLAACVLILAVGAVRFWRRRSAGSGSDRLPSADNGTRTNTSMEIHSLSALENAGPDRTVIP